MESKAAKYNICNDDKDGYCIFEEKADKYDDLIAASNEVVKDNLQLADLQVKITRLEHHLYDQPHFCNCEKI